MSRSFLKHRSQSIPISFECWKNMKETDVLKSWLENRLREYFLTLQARLFNLKENKDYSSMIKIPKFEIMCHELRILDVQINDHELNERQKKWDNFLDCMQGVDPNRKHSLVEGYRTSVSNYTVKFQKDGPNALPETIHLSVYAGEVANIKMLELHPYIPYTEKHLIDIFTKVFPMLEGWSYTRNVQLKLSVPKCYFGKYEDGRKVLMENLIAADNDIMSKVAIGMAIDGEIPVYENHRILILEDAIFNGFERKNALNSSFLPLLNVKAALREIALIHCTSWAFATISKNSFTRVWPFINHRNYLPYLMFLVANGFPEMIHHTETYLLKHAAPDANLVVEHLQKLNATLPTTLAQITIPSNGPLCLIHQGLNFSSVLFKHHLIALSDHNMDAKKISESEKLNKTRTKTKKQLLLIEREVCIVNWYNATYGSPMIDVAFLLLTGLPPITRKTETSALLKLYWEEFEAVAKSYGLSINWNPGEIFKEYLHGLLYGCILISSNVLPNLKPASECIEVFLEAVRDLISLNVI